jgi:hypothetical protein
MQPFDAAGALAGLAFLAVTVVVSAQADPVAFPGAQGFGAGATGGRGGAVYHVTNLNDSGRGSFREAVGARHRIVVFDVGGYVQIHSPVAVAGDITLSGQTAPGGGFGVMGGEVSFTNAGNCIVRNLRFRDGSLDHNWPGPDRNNSHTNCVNLHHTHDMIFDHCSFEFAAYNNVDATAAVKVTFQDCLFADPIRKQQFNFHFETGPGTFIGNIFANAHNRSVLAKADLQFVNNTVYNYQAGFTTGNSSGHFFYDVLGNFFMPGPSTTNKGDAYFQVDGRQSAYAAGNLIDGVPANSIGSARALGSCYFTAANAPSCPTSSLPAVSAAGSVAANLAEAGALPRDEVDAQVIAEIESRSGHLDNTQEDTGLDNHGYGTIRGGAAPLDRDGDGMPDYWETALGLDPAGAGDGGARATDGSGYTNLEEYLNWLQGPHAVAQEGASVQIDLGRYTTGLNNPAYTVSILPAGSGVQSGGRTTVPGTVTVSGGTATFTPAPGKVGLGGFSFTATASNGTITRAVYVCVTPTGPP